VHCTEGELKWALVDLRDVLIDTAIDSLLSVDRPPSVHGGVRSDPVDLKWIIDREERCSD